jgi:FHS family L-fucose permease-like MFS transporter
VGISPLPKISAPAVWTLDREELNHVLKPTPLLFGAITSFLYAGAEIGIGSFLINSIALPDVGAMTPHSAALFVAFCWGGAMLGRFVGWPILQRYRVERVLAVCGGSARALLSISALSRGYVAVVAVLLVGLCNAMVVPVVVMLSITGLGPGTASASSVMVASNIGGGLVPLAMGARLVF